MGRRSVIRVCHVITLLELGGAQQNTLYTCSKLDPARFEVMLIAGQGGYLDAEAQRTLGDRVTLLPELLREIRPVRDVRAYRALRRLLLQLRPHIVHTHSSKAGILGRAAARAAGVPVVLHSIHGFPFNDRQSYLLRRFYIAIERLASRRWTHGFIAVSARNIETGVELGLFKRDAVRLIRSGIDIARFATAHAPDGLRSGLGIPDGAPVVGTVSCLKPQKAPLDFVDVCSRIARDNQDVHFLLAGDGELRGEVERGVARAGIGDRFHLAGWREDVPELLKLLDVFVLTSHWEGLPRAVIQARAAGVPVVATAVDGTVEALRDGESGFLCAPGDTAAIAERTRRLLADANLATRFARAAREGIGEFDQDEMVRRQERLYEALASGLDAAR